MKYFFGILLSLFLVNASSQKFDGSLLLGTTLAQIDGDNLAGFNKIGLTGGVRIDYDLEGRYYTGLELLYTARGSSASLTTGTPSSNNKINLNYLEVPLFFGIKDWYIEQDKYYKVGAEVGLSYGYLYDATQTTGGVAQSTEDFNQSDVSYHLGAFYSFRSNLTLNARYTRSLTALYTDPTSNLNSLRSYYWSIRLMYRL